MQCNGNVVDCRKQETYALKYMYECNSASATSTPSSLKSTMVLFRIKTFYYIVYSRHAEEETHFGDDEKC